jgi:hypothetical protein
MGRTRGGEDASLDGEVFEWECEVKLPRALIPLASQRQWVTWKWRNGSKAPYQARHPDRYASTTDPTTWASFAEAHSVSSKVGFVLAGSGIGALDLDDCRSVRTSALADWAKRLVRQAHSYVEVTPSGAGLRIIGMARGRPVHRVVSMGAGKVEVYRDCPRYITVTGDELGRCTRLANIDALIDELGSPPVRRAVGERRPSRESPRAIIAKHAINGRLARELLHGRQFRTERRHRMHWKLACGLHAAGVPADEAFVLLWETGWNKHTNENAVWNMIGKIWNES